MATFNLATEKGIPFYGTVSTFFVVKKQIDLDDIEDFDIGDTVRAIYIEPGWVVLAVEAIVITPTNNAGNATVNVGDTTSGTRFLSAKNLKATAGTVHTGSVGYNRYTSSDYVVVSPSYSGFAITGVNTSNKTFTVAGNQTSIFTAGSKIKVKGSTGNDGVYTVVSSTYSDPSTTITVSESIPSSTADGNIYKCSVFGKLELRALVANVG